MCKLYTVYLNGNLVPGQLTFPFPVSHERVRRIADILGEELHEQEMTRVTNDCSVFPAKTKTTFTLTVSYVSEDCYNEFDEEIASFIRRGEHYDTGYGFGARDMFFDYKTRKGAENAMKKLSRRKKRYHIISLKIDED